MDSTTAARLAEVQAWRASGQSGASFARERGYSPATLYRWAKAADAAEPGSPAFLRLEVASEQPSAELVVEVGEARVRVAPGFDAELLRAVVDALSLGTRP